MLCLTITNDINELAALEPFVEELSETYGLDTTMTFNLQLALDEALTNVVNYAYGDATGMPITLEAEMQQTQTGRRLVFTLTDKGMPFNPLENAPEVDTTLKAEDRDIGGLGIFLIRQMMDELKYTRSEGKNVFTLIKNV